MELSQIRPIDTCSLIFGNDRGTYVLSPGHFICDSLKQGTGGGGRGAGCVQMQMRLCTDLAFLNMPDLPMVGLIYILL